MSAELTKVDSAVQGLSISPKESKIVKPPKAAKENKEPAAKADKPAKGGKDAKPAAGGKAAAKEPAEVMNINELGRSSTPCCEDDVSRVRVLTS
jgi:hypothetical protein